ncbi:hypothetical protein N8797_01395 [Pontimonas sp.]|nr:hypothetical protein [Pontimonas sp.]
MILRKIRVWFDNTLNRKGALSLWTLAAVFFAIVVGAVIALLPRLLRLVDQPLDSLGPTAKLAQDSFVRSLGVTEGLTILETVANLWFWFIGLMIFGTIFAWRTSALEATKQRILAGRTPLNARGHDVILGWTPTSLTVIGELVRSSPGQIKTVIALLSGEDSREIQNEIDEFLTRSGLNKRARVFVRTGNPANIQDLERVNVRDARSVAILDIPPHSDRYEGVAIATLVAKICDDDGGPHIVLEARGSSAARMARSVTRRRVKTVSGLDIVSKVLAQSARHDAVTDGLLDLLNFGGAEIYSAPCPEGETRDYGDVLTSLRGGALIGVMKNSSLVLNPEPSLEVGPGDELFFVGTDSKAASAVNLDAPPSSDLTVELTDLTATRDEIVAIGSPDHLDSLLTNLSSFLPLGTKVTTISSGESALAPLASPRLQLTHEVLSELVSIDLLQRVPTSAARIIVLADPESAESADTVDARTLLLVELLRQRRHAEGTTRITAEVVASRNRGQFHIESQTNLDTVVGDEVAGMMITQNMANGNVVDALEDLLSPATGSALQIFQPRHSDSDATFSSLLHAGVRVGVSVIGWRVFDGESWRTELNVDHADKLGNYSEVQVIAVGSPIDADRG